MKSGRRGKPSIFFIAFFLFFGMIATNSLLPEEGGTVRTFILDESFLSLGKKLWKAGDHDFTRNIRWLKRAANKALKKGPYSVTFKKYPHPSGDQHDYLAYGNYCWPNPDTPNGLPWVTRDGFSNPDTTVDRDAFKSMIRETTVLSLAYYFTGDELYAKHAAFLLRTWFIDKETRMNPNCNYGKVIPGKKEGGYSVAGFGYRFRELYDSAGILESSPSWTVKDKESFQKWTREYMNWAETTDYGKEERYSQSNHSTFYHMIMVIQALYVGDTAKAREMLKQYRDIQFPRQFSPDGSQPYEMIRANNYDYHICNLEVAFDIARLAEHLDGFDIWNHKSEKGGGLQNSMNFMIPYITGQKEWPYFKRHKFKIVPLHKYRLLRRAALGFKDDSYEEKLKNFPKDSNFYLIDICFPKAAVEKKASSVPIDKKNKK